MAVNTLHRAAGIEAALADPATAHLTIDTHEVVGMHDVAGLTIEPRPIDGGIEVRIALAAGVQVAKPVHLCFGVTEATARQKIRMLVDVGDRASIGILSHCVFPGAEDVRHMMDARITVGAGARYSYLERHVHSPEGGITIVPKAVIHLGREARLTSDFELVRGRVGTIDIDYEVHCARDSAAEMTSKINGSGDDRIAINETALLEGAGARGVLTSRVALRNRAVAQIHNRISADAPHTRGHIDCKEIVLDQATANAVPIVDVKDASAHVTHEAAIGSVDHKQLETLLSRGLSEDEAVDLIIEGLLS